MLQQIIEIFGLITGVLYIWLEIKQNRWMWLLGILTAVVYIWVFLDSKLYAAMALQLYYFGISIYGWISWKRNKTELEGDESIFINKLKPVTVVISIVIGAAIYLLMSTLLAKYTGDPVPKVDSLITALSIVATYWLTKGYIEQWFVWLIANLIAIVLYFYQGLYATSILYIFYFIASVWGYIYWRKKGVLLK